jgi:hypothetical protein
VTAAVNKPRAVRQIKTNLMSRFYICFPLVQLPNSSEVVLPNLLELLIILVPSPNSSSGSWFPQYVRVSRNTQIAGVAAIFWAFWKLYNKACFEGKIINSPIELICLAVVFMKYWVGLRMQDD